MYSLIVFGCYALAKIGLGLIAFKDCSEDAALLDQVSTCGVRCMNIFLCMYARTSQSSNPVNLRF